jgi:ribosomal protein S18 acetylase RimI-like enzyme
MIGFYELDEMISQLNISYFDSVCGLMSAVVSGMQQQGIDQWDDEYPDPITLRNDLEKKQAYGLLKKNVLIGYLCLNDYCDPEYLELEWPNPQVKAVYLHRLAVNPENQGLGIAKKMMSFAESWAKEESYDSLRLDTFSKNPIALNLYRRLGYKEIGTVQFRKGEFVVMEKVL